jgi:hypothetical protein
MGPARPGFQEAGRPVSLDEYVLGLLAIISGLAISELVAEFHRLLFNRKSIQWHWLAPLTALYVALAILASWWVAWGSFHDRSNPLAFGFFLLPVAQLVALFLAARGILPADLSTEHGGKFDLETHYFSVNRYVWGAMTANGLLTLAVDVLAPVIEPMRTQATVIPVLSVLIATYAYALLAFGNSRWLHRLLVPALISWFLVNAIGVTISP